MTAPSSPFTPTLLCLAFLLLMGIVFLAILRLQVRRAKAAISAGEERFLSLFQNMAEGMACHELVMDPQGNPQNYRIIDINPQYERIIGIGREQLIGKLATEAYGVSEAPYLSLYAEVAQTRKPAHFDVYFEPMRKHFDISVTSWGNNGFATIFTDITERKQSEKALRESEERLKLVFEGSNDAFWDWDFRTDEVVASPRWWEMVGINGPNEDAEILIAENIGSMKHKDGYAGAIHPDDREPCEKRLLDHLEGRTPIYYSEHRVLTASGEYRWILDRAKIVERAEDGTPLRIAGTHSDISDRKHEEEARRKLELQLLQSQKLESLGVMAGGIAHDFNNLLTGVLGHASLAMDELPPLSPARENLMEIDRSARRAADLCRQMLAYSGRGTFVIEPINLRELIEEMVHLLRISITKKALLNLNLEKALPPVMGDATQIRQIIMNLVINASEAIGDRSGVITISSGAMQCSGEYLSETYLDENLEPGLYIWFQVSDTGCGMDKETINRLFEPFFTTKFTGRGLGLSAVLGIVRSHKGALKVYSEPGKGTTFKVLLRASETEPLESLPNASQQQENSWKSSGKVLLVDDEETVRTLGMRMLDRMGFEVITAEDGAQGVQLYQTFQNEIRLVILDLTMPHMNGEEAFRELRRINPQVRVLMTSGYSETDIAARFAGKEIAGFLQKPYTFANLTERIKSAII